MPPFDPIQALTRHAEHFRALSAPAAAPHVFFDGLAGGLMWSDELADDTPLDAVRALRLLIAFRTGMMLDEPREEYRHLWDQAQALFPGWVGFRPERQGLTPELKDVFRRGMLAFRQCLREIEKEKGAAGE